MGAITPLKLPLRRRLKATDGTRKARPMFIQIESGGIVTVWPRRCKPESMSVIGIYLYANRLRRERLKKRKGGGK